jgi:hypothetical protein
MLDNEHYGLDEHMELSQQITFKLKTVAPSRVARVGVGGNESD